MAALLLFFFSFRSYASALVCQFQRWSSSSPEFVVFQVTGIRMTSFKCILSLDLQAIVQKLWTGKLLGGLAASMVKSRFFDPCFIVNKAGPVDLVFFVIVGMVSVSVMMCSNKLYKIRWNQLLLRRYINNRYIFQEFKHCSVSFEILREDAILPTSVRRTNHLAY